MVLSRIELVKSGYNEIYSSMNPYHFNPVFKLFYIISFTKKNLSKLILKTDIRLLRLKTF